MYKWTFVDYACCLFLIVFVLSLIIGGWWYGGERERSIKKGCTCTWSSLLIREINPRCKYHKGR
jgi:hypothetical protein